jgi:RimJ/RimL family protein N-acetyltransferase
MAIDTAFTLHDGRRIAARLGTDTDDAALTEYYRQLAAADDAPFFPVPRDGGSLERWLDRGGYRQWGTNVHWIAWADDDGGGAPVVADLFIRRTELPSIGLQGIGQCYLSVAAPYRASGLGGHLMGHARSVLGEHLRALGVRRLTGHIFAENRASIRLVLHAGFELEGVLRQHMRGIDGRYHDMVVCGYLLSDVECPACEQAVAGLVRDGRFQKAST